ncbi:MAG: hypothetical protein ACK6EB_05915, partial [Planctomyces sp.]
PRTHFKKELAELESEKSAEVEAKREKLETPDRKAAGGPGAAGGGPGGPGGGAGGPGGGRGPGGGAGGGGMAMDPKVMFEKMDKDKDGVVTKSEQPQSEFFDRLDLNG